MKVLKRTQKPQTPRRERRSKRREAARAEGQGYASEKADFGATHVQSGTDPVGVSSTPVGL